MFAVSIVCVGQNIAVQWPMFIPVVHCLFSLLCIMLCVISQFVESHENSFILTPFTV